MEHQEVSQRTRWADPAAVILHHVAFTSPFLQCFRATFKIRPDYFLLIYIFYNKENPIDLKVIPKASAQLDTCKSEMMSMMTTVSD